MAGLEVVHDVAGEAGGHGHDAGHVHGLGDFQVAGHLGDGHDEDAEDLHGVDAGLANALGGHGGGQPHAQQSDDDGHDGQVEDEDVEDGEDQHDDGSPLHGDDGVLAGFLGEHAAEDVLGVGDDLLGGDGEADAHHPAQAQGALDAGGEGGVPAEGGLAQVEGADITDDPAQEPDADGDGPDEVAHGDEHGAEPEAGHGAVVGKAGDQLHSGDHGQLVAQDSPDAGHGEGAAEIAHGLAALIAHHQDFRRGLAHGVGHGGLLDEVLAEEGREDQAQDGAGDGADTDLQHADLGVVVQNEEAGDGEGQAAGHHGARGHGGVGDVDLVDVGVAHDLQQTHGEQGDEHDGPGQRRGLQCHEHGRSGEDDGTDGADHHGADGELLLEGRRLLDITQV